MRMWLCLKRESHTWKMTPLIISSLRDVAKGVNSLKTSESNSEMVFWVRMDAKIAPSCFCYNAFLIRLWALRYLVWCQPACLFSDPHAISLMVDVAGIDASSLSVRATRCFGAFIRLVGNIVLYRCSLSICREGYHHLTCDLASKLLTSNRHCLARQFYSQNLNGDRRHPQWLKAESARVEKTNKHGEIICNLVK